MQVCSSIRLTAKVPVRVRSLHSNSTTVNDPSSIAVVPVPKWSQKTITLPPLKRGCHLITPKIVKEIQPDLSGFQCGLAHLFLHHTSASLTINENYDYDVRDDTETFLNRIVPEGPSAPWKHTLEGPDDMPAHIKSSMFGCALMQMLVVRNYVRNYLRQGSNPGPHTCNTFIPFSSPSELPLGYRYQMESLTWGHGRVYGFVSIGIILPHAQ